MQPDPTVHIVDDEESVRRSLALLLRGEGHAVQTHSSVATALDAIDPRSTGCVLTDVKMDGESGLDLLHALKSKGASLPVIVMTGHADVSLAVSAMKQGAADFIEKPFPPDSLIATLNAVLCREETETEMLRRRFSLLTTRERQVLKHLLRGATNKMIAQRLELSPRTVEIYRAKLMLKMQAGSLPELVQMAIAGGFEGD